MKKLISIILLTSVSSSYATGISETQTLPESENLSVYQRTRSDYEPIGIEAGSFVIKPGAWVEVIYNDNIYVAVDKEREEEDVITILRPYVNVESDWSRHALRLSADGAFGFYGDNDGEDLDAGENYIDYNTSLDGRYDIMTKTYLIGGGHYRQKHHDRGDFNFPTAVIEPIEYSDAGGYVGFIRRLGKITLDVEATAKMLDYDDGENEAGFVVDQDYRDRMEYGGNVRIGYEFVPDYLAFVEGGTDIREYEEEFAEGRNSKGYYAILGTSLDISGKTKGEIYAGYMTREYEDDATYDEINGVMLGGKLLWNVTELTSLIAKGTRSIEETIFANYSGYILTTADLAVEHELKRNILFGANIGWDNYDYQGNSSLTEEMKFDVMRAGVQGDFLMNRNLKFGAGYKYEERASNDNDNDYRRNIFLINARVAF